MLAIRLRAALSTLTLIWLCVGVSGQALASQQIEASIVRIVNVAQKGDSYSPWNSTGPRQSVGTGFVIEGGLVMTNAHVVSDARVLSIYLSDDPNPHEARVRWVAHDCDLAVIEPIEPGLLEGVPALGFGRLPPLGSEVETYGYPAGGQRISSTRGVVSRIEMNLFSHSALDYHLTVQTDAAINPGNSGGPVLQSGKVVGVAFQAATDLENVGFFIPTEVVQHFLLDVKDGHYDGYPELGATTANLESPAARRRAGMRSDGDTAESGVRVDFIFPQSSADGLLDLGDVILAVDGHTVANDGTVSENGVRLHFGVILDRHQVGTSVHLHVLRDGQRIDIAIPMERYEPLRRYANRYDAPPRYYIYAGLVFVPLDRDTLVTFGEDWGSNADKHLINEYSLRIQEEPERILRNPIILLRRLDHSANANMAWYRNLLVEKINGRPIHSLSDVIEAFETNEDEYHLLEFGYYGRFGVLEREAAERANVEVLEQYGVAADRRL